MNKKNLLSKFVLVGFLCSCVWVVNAEEYEVKLGVAGNSWAISGDEQGEATLFYSPNAAGGRPVCVMDSDVVATAWDGENSSGHSWLKARTRVGRAFPSLINLPQDPCELIVRLQNFLQGVREENKLGTKSLDGTQVTIKSLAEGRRAFEIVADYPNGYADLPSYIKVADTYKMVQTRAELRINAAVLSDNKRIRRRNGTDGVAKSSLLYLAGS